MQYTVNITQHDGKTSALFPALVALCEGGQILRIDEYIDSMKRGAAARGKLINTPAAEAFIQHRGHAYPRSDLLAEIL